LLAQHFLALEILRLQLRGLLLSLALLLAAGHEALSANPTGKALKIGFLTVGPVSDHGYNYSHNLGRLYLDSHLPGAQTTLAESVPENADAGRIIERMIAQGNTLIFCTAFGYFEPAEQVAKKHPEVTIMQAWRATHLKNMGTYAVYQYEPLYAVGLVAGRMTKTNKLGFICGHPVPNQLQNINAFTLGARSVNPKVKVHVVWTNAWSDPPVEAEAAKALIDSGVDVLGSTLDNPQAVLKTAGEHHVMVFGAYADLRSIAPKFWTTGSRWNWEKVYLQIASSVKDGTWKPGAQWFGVKDGAVGLSSFGEIVPKDVKEQALAKELSLQQGKTVIFKGPMKDRKGMERIPSGQAATEKSLSEMDWLVDGVEGALPNGK
jgi:basic membrane protein A and related proteins